jgi:hypothetical protein
LRCINADPNSNGEANSNGDFNSNTHSNTHFNANSHGHSDSASTDTYANAYGDSNADIDPYDNTDYSLSTVTDGRSYQGSQHTVQFHGTSKRH